MLISKKEFIPSKIHIFKNELYFQYITEQVQQAEFSGTTIAL
jgi:hypothetical protein